MKLPPVPLPEPLFAIEVTRGSVRQQRAVVLALRFLLWDGPSAAAAYGLATTGSRPPLDVLLGTFAVLAAAMLTIWPHRGGQDAS